MEINWSNYKWESGQPWGTIHPDKTIQWYDPSAIVENSDGSLTFKTHYNPKYFDHLGVTSPIGIGLMTSSERFGYGTFEIDAKLPKGKQLWPAFWMYPTEGEYREIDIFEAYSNNCGNYLNFYINNIFSLWKIETNLHIKNEDDSWGSRGPKSKFFTWKNPAKNFNNYKLVWTPDELSIYYNDKLVRSADSDYVDACRDYKFRVLINNALRNDADITSSHKTSEFVVERFRYTPL